MADGHDLVRIRPPKGKVMETWVKIFFSFLNADTLLVLFAGVFSLCRRFPRQKTRGSER
jgi:hypothetical protein